MITSLISGTVVGGPHVVNWGDYRMSIMKGTCKMASSDMERWSGVIFESKARNRLKIPEP
jgi:hypothetical protein